MHMCDIRCCVSLYAGVYAHAQPTSTTCSLHVGMICIEAYAHKRQHSTTVSHVCMLRMGHNRLDYDKLNSEFVQLRGPRMYNEGVNELVQLRGTSLLHIEETVPCTGCLLLRKSERNGTSEHELAQDACFHLKVERNENPNRS